MSELQQIMTLFQLLRWIVTKLYTIAKLTIGIYLDFEQNESHTKVIESIMREYSVENMLELCSDIIGAFKKDWEKISTAVYARDFDEYIVNGTFFEIAIFKRMFLEQCYALDLNPYPLDKKVTCSHVTSAHEMCPSLTPGNTCPVYFPCEKIFCEDLEEPTKVCKRNVPEGREYYYHLSSNEEDSRDCEDGSYWVHYKEWRDDNTACTPCKCICEKQDESSSKSYYYSTELSIANTANNMVVTGAKLEIINNTLVIVQQHGRLCPNGIICPNTTSWLSPKLVQKEKISLEEMNIVDLTRIVLGKDQVITGLSFQKGFGDPSIGHRIRLKVNANVFDFESGTLRDEQGLYFSESGASEVEPAEVISSSRQSSNIIIRDKFVKFTVSGGKTGGRITLPLIDARNVEPDPPTPLSGAGLYLRRKEDGSLIGLEMMTYNTKYLLFGKK
ncbi:hypothetical protein QAD02_005147 [Eretmocerus hayati]|uniref:Uncharacterized protein n=1 Tax=Eretmocerus hayati TaxID=131215 RepID=A0ACC2NRI0_9HYME|nr:hypothetical protein QAD02_005147 [Eretmocerus hayati]